MELLDIDTTKEIVKKTTKLDKNFLIYGEPWKGGSSPLVNGTYKGSQKNENFSIFNDTFRDAIRGNNHPSSGFINGNQYSSICNWSIIEGLKGSIYTITSNPNESINYVDAHDNYTLWDQVEKSQNQSIKFGEFRFNIPDYPLNSNLVKQDLLGMAIIFTAQGIPFIQSGSEFLKTKQGDHNSYKSNDYINSIKWSDKERFIDVFKYNKGLIEIRKNLPHFKIKDPKIIKSNATFIFGGNNESCGVLLQHINLNDFGKGEVLVIYNGTNIENYNVTSYAPLAQNGYWNIIANESTAGMKVLNTIYNNQIPALRAFSIMILCSNLNLN